jgi:hypothetical protein
MAAPLGGRIVEDNATQPGSGGSPAEAGAAIATISTPSPESEAKLRALVTERGPALRIRLDAPADFDVSGHEADVTSLTLRVDDGDDTEGHAISLHFPGVEEAKQFQQRMIATGAIVGTLVIAGGGLALSQTLPDAGATTSTQAQVESTAGSQAPVDSISISGTSPSTGGVITGKERALLSEMTGVDVAAPTSSPGASPSTGGAALTGKEKALLSEMTGGDAVDEER